MVRKRKPLASFLWSGPLLSLLPALLVIQPLTGTPLPTWGLPPSPQGSAVCRTDSPLPAQGPTGLGVTILCELFWDPCSLTRNTVGQEGSFAWRVGHPAEQISWLTSQGPTTWAGYSVARNCSSLRPPLRPSETCRHLAAGSADPAEGSHHVGSAVNPGPRVAAPGEVALLWLRRGGGGGLQVSGGWCRKAEVKGERTATVKWQEPCASEVDIVREGGWSPGILSRAILRGRARRPAMGRDW